MMAAVAAAAGGCTPAPRYHGKPETRAGERPERRRPATAPSELPGFTFRHPLRNLRDSRINSVFGLRTDPLYGTREFHQGIDIAAETGEDVFAASAGEVGFAGRQRGYGKVIIIEHPEGYASVYAHLAVVTVRKGDAVEIGQRIGKVGLSGNSTGSHLHFEIRLEGEALDPLDFIRID